LLLACSVAFGDDAALENARAAADALAAGKSDEAADHCGKLLTFDLAPETWVDVHFALLCLRPKDLERLLSRIERKPWMEKEDLSRWPDLVQRVNRDPKGAAEILAARLEKSPDDAVLLNLLASACEGMGKGEEAAAGYEQARKAAGKPTCFWINMPQMSIALLLKRKKRDDDAYLLEREVVSSLTPLPDPREALAGGDLAAGAKALRDVAYFRTQLAMALSNVGAYEASQGKQAEAIDSYRKSLAIEPRDAQTHANLSAALYAIDDATAALKSIEEALRLDPKNDIYQKERAIILSKVNGGEK